MYQKLLVVQGTRSMTITTFIFVEFIHMQFQSEILIGTIYAFICIDSSITDNLLAPKVPEPNVRTAVTCKITRTILRALCRGRGAYRPPIDASGLLFLIIDTAPANKTGLKASIQYNLTTMSIEMNHLGKTVSTFCLQRFLCS